MVVNSSTHPIMFQKDVGDDNFFIPASGVSWAFLPKLTSAVKRGIPIIAVRIRYTRLKAPPPLSQTIYGYLQMLPIPIANPAVAIMNPNLLPQFSLTI